MSAGDKSEQRAADNVILQSRKARSSVEMQLLLVELQVPDVVLRRSKHKDWKSEASLRAFIMAESEKHEFREKSRIQHNKVRGRWAIRGMLAKMDVDYRTLYRATDEDWQSVTSMKAFLNEEKIRELTYENGELRAKLKAAEDKTRLLKPKMSSGAKTAKGRKLSTSSSSSDEDKPLSSSHKAASIRRRKLI